MLSYGAPLSASAIISGFQAQYYAFLLPIFYITDNVAIGNYGIASTFVVLISFFATPITTMLFPAFSKLDAQKDKRTMQNVFQYSVKYAAFLVVPIAALVMCLAEPAVSTLFGQTYASAPLFLALLALTYFLPAFGSLSISNFISSQGKTTFIMYLTLISAAIGLPLGYILIMQFGVLGLIITTLVTGIVYNYHSSLLGQKKLWVNGRLELVSKNFALLLRSCHLNLRSCFRVGLLQLDTINRRCSIFRSRIRRCNHIN